MWYSTNGDRLIPDRRRQTNFTLLGEPLQSWHHNVPCFCQRSERDKWQRAAALLFSVSNICPDVCFSQGFFYFFIFFCSGLAIFNTQPSYRADRTADLACASVSQQIKKRSPDQHLYLQFAAAEQRQLTDTNAAMNIFKWKKSWNYLIFLMNWMSLPRSVTAWLMA